MHRDVARVEVVLQAVEHAPAVDVGQADVERDRVGLVLARERDRGRCRCAVTMRLEAVLVRERRAGSCAKAVSFSTISSDAVAGSDVDAGRRRPASRASDRLGRSAATARRDADALGALDVDAGCGWPCATRFDGAYAARQVERERAALAGRAREPDLAAEQAARSRG